MQHLPRATYRVQLNRKFTFDDAAGILDYLADLGVSHLYASPCLQAAQGSTHGYDVVDHTRANSELGGQEGFERLVAALKKAGMGMVLDIVPNHMAISGGQNRWWWDVLENGQSSRYAPYFDVDWDPAECRFGNRILLPILETISAVSRERRDPHENGGQFSIATTTRCSRLAPFPGLVPAKLEAVRLPELCFHRRLLSSLPQSSAGGP